MKKYIILLFLFGYSILSFGQKEENLNLLETDATYRQEAFNFPIPFAKEIDFKGIADVRFSKGWHDKNSPDFWTYAIGWEIALNEKLSEAALENYMRLYFDGLMDVVNKEDKEIPKTIASFIEISHADDKISYKGSIKIYDAFFTKKTMLLNVTLDYSYCEQKNKSLMLFRFSPKNRETDIWINLEKVKFKNDICSPLLDNEK